MFVSAHPIGAGDRHYRSSIPFLEHVGIKCYVSPSCRNQHASIAVTPTSIQSHTLSQLIVDGRTTCFREQIPICNDQRRV